MEKPYQKMIASIFVGYTIGFYAHFFDPEIPKLVTMIGMGAFLFWLLTKKGKTPWVTGIFYTAAALQLGDIFLFVYNNRLHLKLPAWVNYPNQMVAGLFFLWIVFMVYFMKEKSLKTILENAIISTAMGTTVYLLINHLHPGAWNFYFIPLYISICFVLMSPSSEKALEMVVVSVAGTYALSYIVSMMVNQMKTDILPNVHILDLTLPLSGITIYLIAIWFRYYLLNLRGTRGKLNQ